MRCLLQKTRHRFRMLTVCLILSAMSGTALVQAADDKDAIEVVTTVERQPLIAATQRLVQALEVVGDPLSQADRDKLSAAFKIEDDVQAVTAVQRILDPLCLAVVTINAESRVSAIEGPVKKELMQQGWRSFLIKVHNAAGITPQLAIDSPQAAPIYERGRGARQKPLTDDMLASATQGKSRFLDIESFIKQPLKPRLSGLAVEYRIVQLYSRDVGKREATFKFNVGQGTQDLGFRSELPVLFQCVPAVEILLSIFDETGSPTTAALVIRDAHGRVYPNPARRLAPDFFFHNQVYRAAGESIDLPPGEYDVTVSRGPEYHVLKRKLIVKPKPLRQRADFELTRWIHPKARGWYSGDHHVHAAGCKHYDSPTEGVGPADMMRHIVGEDLNVGCVLSWGPCWYTQKQFFEGKAHALSKPDYLMRYDVEVSGFPSSHAGHLCLLRLKEDDYPGTEYIEQWPGWTLPVLKWGQAQGGVVGYSHSGWGLGLPDYGPNGTRLATIHYPNRKPTGGRAADTLPDYAMPPFDGIGANEYIVTAALGACDFISAVDTPAIWELNIWYHTLNCGLKSRISGETDFPCIYGDKVGLGRIYVKMPDVAGDGKPLDFDVWCQGLKDGRSYCGDGLSHVLDFRMGTPGKASRDVLKDGRVVEGPPELANIVRLGETSDDGDISTLEIAQPGKVLAAFDVAALLEEQQTEETRRIKNARLDHKPYWHIERCRIGDSRKVPVEVIVNGEVAYKTEIAADGKINSLNVALDIKESSWVAVRILPSVHTNPIWVQVGDKPVRANRKSAEWCRKAVEVCWQSKQGRIKQEERAAARKAYDAAAEYYQKVLTKSPKEKRGR